MCKFGILVFQILIMSLENLNAKIGFYTCWSNDCKHDADHQTFVESIPALKFEILEGLSQTCIRGNVQVIIDAPE